MKQRIKSSRIITPDKIVDGYLVFENGKIEYIGGDDKEFEGVTIDVRDNIVTAGFIEMHIHGSNGSVRVFDRSTGQKNFGGLRHDRG